MNSDSPIQGRIILVGNRKGAVAAAKRCGWDPIVIDVKARREQSHLAFGGGSDWAVDYVRELWPEGDDIAPLGVVAVTTGSVVAAAAIRQYFGLAGIGPEVAMRCHDKLVMKKAIVAAGLPCAPWLETNEATTASGLIDLLGLPLVLKMPISSGGRGVWICRDSESVEDHLLPQDRVERAAVREEGRASEAIADKFDLVLFQDTHISSPTDLLARKTIDQLRS